MVKVIDRLDPWGRGTEMIGEVRSPEEWFQSDRYPFYKKMFADALARK